MFKSRYPALIALACSFSIVSGCGGSGGGSAASPLGTNIPLKSIVPTVDAAPSLPVSSPAAPTAPAVAFSAPAPGGIMETNATAQVRPLLTQGEIQTLLPERGVFTFPAPYNTAGVRITNATDCAGKNCVYPVGYSYWRNINNHVASDTMYIFLGMDKSKGGAGPTLFSYDKKSDAITEARPLFTPDSPYSLATGEGWYFSATLPTKLYMNDGSRMLRYDVLSHEFQTVFDVASQFGANMSIGQMHSSNDDRVHSATLKDKNWKHLGCVVYRADTGTLTEYPKKGEYDECQIDKSGRWLLIKEDLDGAYGEDNRIIDIDSGRERFLMDQDGAGGHSDMGFGTMVAADNWSTSQSNLQKIWQLDAGGLQATTAYYNLTWDAETPSHISFTNASGDVPMSEQYACGSSANRELSAHSNEVICFRTGASSDVLVIAPVMTDMNASGGGDDYSKAPKGNLDITGKYFIWTSNMGGNRLDAFIVKVPSQKLMGS